MDRRFEEAEPLVLEAWKSISAAFPATDPRVAAARARVVEMYAAWGRPQRAQEVLATAAVTR